jgi:hypothetical protein
MKVDFDGNRFSVMATTGNGAWKPLVRTGRHTHAKAPGDGEDVLTLAGYQNTPGPPFDRAMS